MISEYHGEDDWRGGPPRHIRDSQPCVGSVPAKGNSWVVTGARLLDGKLKEGSPPRKEKQESNRECKRNEQPMTT